MAQNSVRYAQSIGYLCCSICGVYGRAGIPLVYKVVVVYEFERSKQNNAIEFYLRMLNMIKKLKNTLLVMLLFMPLQVNGQEGMEYLGGKFYDISLGGCNLRMFDCGYSAFHYGSSGAKYAIESDIKLDDLKLLMTDVGEMRDGILPVDVADLETRKWKQLYIKKNEFLAHMKSVVKVVSGENEERFRKWQQNGIKTFISPNVEVIPRKNSRYIAGVIGEDGLRCRSPSPLRLDPLEDRLKALGGKYYDIPFGMNPLSSWSLRVFDCGYSWLGYGPWRREYLIESDLNVDGLKLLMSEDGKAADGYTPLYEFDLATSEWKRLYIKKDEFLAHLKSVVKVISAVDEEKFRKRVGKGPDFISSDLKVIPRKYSRYIAGVVGEDGVRVRSPSALDLPSLEEYMKRLEKDEASSQMKPILNGNSTVE